MFLRHARAHACGHGDARGGGGAGRRGAASHLTTALARLAQRERYLACELEAHRYDIGVKYGLLTAQLALALDGQDRDEVLSGLVELVARAGVS